ncbi:WD repeat-containing protein 35 [Caerostris extrusa]|uniref:WD repeat-containing protein 35 n=1 Tax=Caerostris extrusa TaxID=172846 RepID=A0AAV4VB12_CAEEX|nr:WD repeat-containing protein 35 [Caerostris extrusa]
MESLTSLAETSWSLFSRRKVPITSNDNKRKDDLIMINWFKKQKDPDVPSLAIVFESGVIQLLKNENDSGPVVVDTGLIISCLEWNFKGSIIALLHILRFAGNICGLSWEGNGQRIALAVDCYIFFATIRPYYKKHIKLVKNLISLASFGDFCCIASKSDDISKEFSLVVCNAIGSPIDSCNINLEPRQLCMNSSDVFAASRNSFCRFHFHSPKSKSLMQFTTEKPGLSDERPNYFLPSIIQFINFNMANAAPNSSFMELYLRGRITFQRETLFLEELQIASQHESQPFKTIFEVLAETIPDAQPKT